MKDLTQGKPLKLITLFAVPILIGNIFQQLYNLCDTMIVGQTLGKDALAAVGATSSIANLIVGFLFGITNGFSIIIAKHYGSGNLEKMRRASAGTLMLGLILAVLFTVISFIGIKPLLQLLQTPENIIDRSYNYIIVILGGMIFSMLYNVCSSILRALGDSVTPLFFLLISSVINVGLDFTFILGLKMDVEGAALATVIANAVSVVLCALYINMKVPQLHLQKSDFKITAKETGELLSSGFSMGFMLSVVSIGSVVLQGAINSFGTDIIAAHTAARKVDEMLMLPFTTVSAASATYCSQNLGAGKLGRIREGIKTMILMSWGWATAALVLSLVFSKLLISLLTGSNEELILDTAFQYLNVNIPFFFVLSVLLVLRSSMQGLGRKIVPVVVSMIEMVGKVLVAFLLAPAIGYLGIMLSEPIIWIACAVPLIIIFLSDKRFSKRNAEARISSESVER